MRIKAGIDIGSVTTKCVLMEDEKILSKVLIQTGTDSEKSAEYVFTEALKSTGISEEDVSRVVSTGYGRRRYRKADKIITEISAAGLGAFILSGYKKCLVIDLGGQDTKIIEVDNNGQVRDFLMNDKCAAGTGRFLEIMANMLETDMDGFSELALGAKHPVKINATCSVFAESEVVSLLAGASKKEDIAGGLINAISIRISAMFSQFQHNDHILFCGGGARSQALKKSLEKEINRSITVLDNPQFVTAFGAALVED